MRRFEYFEPATLDDAVALLGRLDGRAQILAGGTDLLVEIKESIRQPDHVINIKRIPGLDRLEYDGATGLRLGALVSARAVETAAMAQQFYPSLVQAAKELGSIQIRNRATIVGNVCRASPSADTLPPLIADDATAHIFGSAGERAVTLEDFFTGPGQTVLAPDEIVRGITVPGPVEGTGKAYIKHGRRKAMELATVGVAVTLVLERGTCRDIRIVLGAVAPTPIRARAAEASIRGHALDAGAVAAAAVAAMQEAKPIGNVRASAEYRREMVGVLTRRAIEEAARRAAPPAERAA